QPLPFSLSVRRAGDPPLPLIDPASVRGMLDPPAPVRTEVSGDRKFLTVIPLDRLAGPAGGPLHVDVEGDYLVNPDRDGLRFSGGSIGGAVAPHLDLQGRPAASAGALPPPARP